MKRRLLFVIGGFTILAFLLKSADTQGLASNYSLVYGALIAIRIIADKSIQRSHVDTAWTILVLCIGAILLAYVTISFLPKSFITYGRFKVNENESIPLGMFLGIAMILGYMHVLFSPQPLKHVGKMISDLIGEEKQKIVRTPVDQQLRITKEELYLFLGTAFYLSVTIIFSITALIFLKRAPYFEGFLDYSLHQILCVLSYTIVFLHFPYLTEERKPYFMYYVYGLFVASFVITLFRVL